MTTAKRYCEVCRRSFPYNEFGRVAGQECCARCMPILIEANAKSIKKFVDGFTKAQSQEGK